MNQEDIVIREILTQDILEQDNSGKYYNYNGGVGK